MLIAILVLSGLAALGSSLGAGIMILTAFYSWKEIRDQERAAANQKATEKERNI